MQPYVTLRLTVAAAWQGDSLKVLMPIGFFMWSAPIVADGRAGAGADLQGVPARLPRHCPEDPTAKDNAVCNRRDLLLVSVLTCAPTTYSRCFKAARVCSSTLSYRHGQALYFDCMPSHLT